MTCGRSNSRVLSQDFFGVFFNSFGFYKSFRRPSDASMKKYLIPEFGIPCFFVIVNPVLMNLSERSRRRSLCS
jgi:hypothetical protein